jgi:hypothetical protein
VGKILQMKNCLAHKGVQTLLMWPFINVCFLIHNTDKLLQLGERGTNQDFDRTEIFDSHSTCILFLCSRATTTYGKNMQDPFQNHFNAPVNLGAMTGDRVV